MSMSLGYDIGYADRRWGGLPKLGTPASALIGTTHTTGMGADAFTWSDGRPVRADKYGNLFAIAEDGAGAHWWLWKNVGGAWTDGAHSWASLTRGTVAYDAVNNVAHVLWTTTQANGGVVYRRYVIAYSGQNISDITEDTGLTIGGVVQARTNVVLDDGTAMTGYEHPGILFLNDAGYGALGAIVCIWACTGGTGNEVRMTMLNFNGVGAAAQTLGNWAAPAGTSSTTLGANTAPAVAYSAVHASASAGTPYCAMQRKAAGTHANDLYIWYETGGGANYKYRRAQWAAGSLNWVTGLIAAVQVGAVVRAGTNFATGYNGNRTQLITRPTESTTGDCIFMGALTWASDALGDTWTLYKIDNADAITTTDVFSFAGSSNTTSAPWGDVQYDTAKSQLIVTYNNASNFPQMQTCNDAMGVINAAVQLWSVVNGADVPSVLDGGSVGGTIWVLFRDTAAGHNGYAVSTNWA